MGKKKQFMGIKKHLIFFNLWAKKDFSFIKNLWAKKNISLSIILWAKKDFLWAKKD